MVYETAHQNETEPRRGKEGEATRATRDQTDKDGQNVDPDNTATRTQEVQNSGWTVVEKSRNAMKAKNSQRTSCEGDEIMVDRNVTGANNGAIKQSKDREQNPDEQPEFHTST